MLRFSASTGTILARSNDYCRCTTGILTSCNDYRSLFFFRIYLHGQLHVQLLQWNWKRGPAFEMKLDAGVSLRIKSYASGFIIYSSTM